MESYVKFRKHLATMESKKAALLNDKSIIEQRIAVVKNQVDTAMLFDNLKEATELKKSLQTLSDKLGLIDESLSLLDPLPYALAVYQEAEGELIELRRQADGVWAEAVEDRNRFLNDLQRLADLRLRSFRIQDMTREAGPFCKRNPTAVLTYHGYHTLSVDTRTIDKLIG